MIRRKHELLWLGSLQTMFADSSQPQKHSRRGWNRLVCGRGQVYRHFLLSSQLQYNLALRFNVEAVLPCYRLLFLKEGGIFF